MSTISGSVGEVRSYSTLVASANNGNSLAMGSPHVTLAKIGLVIAALLSALII